MQLDGGSFVSGPYVPRTGRGGGPGYDDNGNDDEENDEVSPEGRPEANPDWERQVVLGDSVLETILGQLGAPGGLGGLQGFNIYAKIVKACM
eukprot:scaffold23270_cov22-Tisochrysis_lutea.AAC.1